MSTQERFDLVILGSGSTAFAAALHAAELGKTVAMTEERTVGGTCANRGCLPSKNLIEAARLVYHAASIRFLEGRQPRLAQVPPTVRNSVITAVLPSSAACKAAAKAVEPLPRITRSCRSCVEVIVALISLVQAG